jgi:ribonuclease HII
LATDNTGPYLFEDFNDQDDSLAIERGLIESGYKMVAGVDEAGRGPLAGPVVAAAVILDMTRDYPLVGDSKKMGPDQRERAFRLIMFRARAVGLGLVSSEDIDRTNILKASLSAMKKAVEQLDPRPDFVLVDGNFKAPLKTPQKALVKGDSRSLSVGAASIVAKVIRDRLMTAYDLTYPGYDFAAHKGYGTKKHLTAISLLGPCPLHRKSFKGIKPEKEQRLFYDRALLAIEPSGRLIFRSETEIILRR